MLAQPGVEDQVTSHDLQEKEEFHAPSLHVLMLGLVDLQVLKLSTELLLINCFI